MEEDAPTALVRSTCARVMESATGVRIDEVMWIMSVLDACGAWVCIVWADGEDGRKNCRSCQKS